MFYILYKLNGEVLKIMTNKILLILIAIFFIGCEGEELSVPSEEKKEPVVIESYFESKKPALFEHYYIYQLYSNYQLPILQYEEVIDLVAKAHNVSSNDFYKLYKEEYNAWMQERMKRREKYEDDILESIKKGY